MPDPAEPNQNSGSLDSRVGTLLQEALDAAGRVEGELDVHEAAAPTGGPAAASPAPSPRSNESEAVSQAALSFEQEHTDIGQLDDDLARLTESLISSEAVSPGGAAPIPTGPVSSPPVAGPGPGKTVTTPPPAAAAGLTKTEPPASATAAHTAATVPMGNVPAGGAVASAPVDAAAQRAAPAPSTAAPISAPRSTSVSPRTDWAADAEVPAVTPGLAKSSLAKVAAGTAPIALAGLAAVSKPLLAKPRAVRDTVGWLAIWTFFLASCVWVYLLFVHKPAPPESRTSPIELVTQERLPAVASGDEAAVSSTHADPAAHAESGGEAHH